MGFPGFRRAARSVCARCPAASACWAGAAARLSAAGPAAAPGLRATSPPGDPWGQPPTTAASRPRWRWGQPQPMWQPPPAYPLAPDAYPVNVSYDREAPINRLWGIPFVGQLVRLVLAHPAFPGDVPAGRSWQHSSCWWPGSRCSSSVASPAGAIAGPAACWPTAQRVAGVRLLMTSDLPTVRAAGRGLPGDRPLRRGRAHQPPLGHPPHRLHGACDRPHPTLHPALGSCPSSTWFVMSGGVGARAHPGSSG